MRADPEASQMRLRDEMRVDAAASHTRLRDEFQSRDDRLIQSLTDVIDKRMMQMFAFCRDESRGGPSGYDPHRRPPDPPPTT